MARKIARKKQATKETIWLYFLFTMATSLGMSFISAIYVMFLISRGLNLFEINIVNFVFFTTLFICEVPTGAVADVFGRKVSYVCSCFLFSLSMFVYAISTSFWGFVLAEIIAAVGYTFSSGAFQAWLVDRLKHQEYTGSLNLIFSKEQQIIQISAILGSISGAFLSNKDMVFPWIVGGGVMFIAGILSIFLMKEEYFTRQKFSFRNGFQSMKNTIQASINYGIKSEIVRFIILIGTVQCFAVQAPNMQWQPFFSQFLPNKTSLGFLFAGISVAILIGAALSSWFLRKAKDEKLALIISQIIIGVGIASAAIFNVFSIAISIFLFHEIARGIFRPLKNVYLNENIPSKERATIISFESMSYRVGGMIGLIFSGFIAENISITSAWLLSGGILIAITLAIAKNHKNNNCS